MALIHKMLLWFLMPFVIVINIWAGIHSIYFQNKAWDSHGNIPTAMNCMAVWFFMIYANQIPKDLAKDVLGNKNAG